MEVSYGFIVPGVFTYRDFSGLFPQDEYRSFVYRLCLSAGADGGIADAEIIKGFNASLFLMLLGVTYLFSLAQLNGTLDLLAQKVIALAGKRIYLIPIIIYVFSTILAAIGPVPCPRWRL